MAASRQASAVRAVAFAVQLGPLTKFVKFLSDGIGPDRQDDGLWLFLYQGSKVSDEGKPMQKPRRTAASPVNLAAVLLRALQKEPLEVRAVRASLIQARHGEGKDYRSTGDDSVGDSGI
ncbi:hypothetical protein ACHAP6_002569 [Verticillium nonalfalfae]